MAKSSSASIQYRFYNGGWSDDYSSTLHGGYTSNQTYAVVLKVTLPKLETTYTVQSLTVKVPYVRQYWLTATSGTLYAKVYTSDPSGTKNLPIPSASNCHASTSWSASDLEVHTSTFTLTYDNCSVLPSMTSTNKVIYIAIGCNTHFLQLGYSGYDSYYAIKANWYTPGPSAKATITDNGNNTATMSCTNGPSYESNPLKGATLYWTTNGSAPVAGTSYTYSESLGKTPNQAFSKTINIPSTCSKVIAHFWRIYTHNNAGAANEKAVKYYVRPGNPGTPIISYTKTRLTLSENWTFTWAAATKGNNNSPIAGYRISLYKKASGASTATAIAGVKLKSGTTATLTKGTGTATHFDLAGTGCTVKFNPADFGFAVGDKVSIGVQAYAIRGDNTKLFSTSTVKSSESTVQRQSTVHVKTASGWKVGQVYIKTANGWKEAESVYVKTASGWKESI